MNNQNNSLANSSNFSRNEDKQFVIKSITNTIENLTGLTIEEFKTGLPEDQLFYKALYYCTATKKAICSALGIPIEAGCRYKRRFEKSGRLIQSASKIICPFTKHKANELSTNPDEFERLTKSKQYRLDLW